MPLSAFVIRMHRFLLLAALAFIARIATACTAFVVTRDGHTFIGGNEDAWSINPLVRFEQAGQYRYGAIYLSHYNGHPFNGMTDQLGMNEAGLTFDGLGISGRPYRRKAGLPSVSVQSAMLHVMRNCADVHEAAAYLSGIDMGLSRSMLFLADRNGHHLVVEPDTMMLGNDVWYAVGNWPMSSCGDPASIPIPRLQSGRTILAGAGEADRIAHDALESMIACRTRMGEGTLFSALFSPIEGRVLLWFYHDFAEVISFDLKEELAQGDHTIAMASLFGTRPEFEALKAYLTPFHQHWLFWMLACIAMIAILLGLAAGVLVLARAIRRLRGKSVAPWWPPFLAGLSMMLVFALITVFLTNENVFYFGLSDLHFALGLLPIIVLLLGVVVARRAIRTSTDRWLLVPTVVLLLPIVLLCGYWGLLWP